MHFRTFHKNRCQNFRKVFPPPKNPGYPDAMLDENKDVNQFCCIADETILPIFIPETVSFVSYPSAARGGKRDDPPSEVENIFAKNRFFSRAVKMTKVQDSG